MRNPIRVSILILGLATACGLVGALHAAATSNPFLGRWALTIAGGGAGWLEVKQEGGRYTGSILWGGGSVVPLASVKVADDTLTVTREREVERKGKDGKSGKQKVTETLTAKVEGDTLKGTRVAPRAGGGGEDRGEFSGKRIPPLPARPNLAAVKFGSPIALFNGRDLAGWRTLPDNVENAWVVDNGVLANRPPPHVTGQPRRRTANIRTEREFEDFNLKLEVSVPAGSNSGVYLRGIYEVQIADSYGKPLDSHNMGAIYSRITPTVAAEKPAGEWQTLEMTLVDRHATVILNGKTIIENQPLEGCTGGALWSDQFRPGPVYLQGDHGPVSYRNIVLRPVVK